MVDQGTVGFALRPLPVHNIRMPAAS